MSFDFTACFAEGGKLAIKKIFARLGRDLAFEPYDRITWWRFAPAEAGSLEEMATFLRTFAAERHDMMIIMGAPKPGLDLRREHRRLWADPATRTLVDVPRAWLAIDVDDYCVPPPYGSAGHLADAARAVRDDALGEEFVDVACVVNASAKTGLVGEELARLKLFFLLDQPHPIDALHRWAQGAQLAGLAVDPSVMQVGQPIYTGRPKFFGMADPVPAELRAFVLPGSSGRVALELERHAARAAVIEHRVRVATAAAGRDWRRLLDGTLGSEAGFFAPLSQALGIAARSGDSDAEIQAHVAALLARRADPARLRQYGPRWVASTLRSFRGRDADKHAAARAAYAAVFGREPA